MAASLSVYTLIIKKHNQIRLSQRAQALICGTTTIFYASETALICSFNADKN